MSLKAYDGMMTRNDFEYIQNKLTERLPEFLEISKSTILKQYALLITDYVDDGRCVVDKMLYHAHNETNVKAKIEKIDTSKSLLSVIYQGHKILSEGYFINDFMGHLRISLQYHNGKFLIYPNIIVERHRRVLNEIFEDWYCQDQCDPDEDVSEDEWEERKKDWYAFNEVRGLKTQIVIFDPTHHWDNLPEQMRSDDFVDSILQWIPSDETRVWNIAKKRLFNEMLKNPDKSNYVELMQVGKKIKENDNKLIKEYIQNNNIELTKIDSDFLDLPYKEKDAKET